MSRSKSMFGSLCIALILQRASSNSTGTQLERAQAPDSSILQSQATVPSSDNWEFERPLRVCVTSIEDFGARCNGSPSPFWEGKKQPEGDVPAEGWCGEGVDFCGYDVEVWRCGPLAWLFWCHLPVRWLLKRQSITVNLNDSTLVLKAVVKYSSQLAPQTQLYCAAGPDTNDYLSQLYMCTSIGWTECRNVAQLLNLQEEVHYQWVCMGEIGFGPMLDDLAREDWNRPSNASDPLSRHHPGDEYLCDIGASAITANTERVARGIRFSRATLRSDLAIMIHAPLLERGKWAFFAPIALSAWFMLAATIMVVPLFVFFFEAVFSNHCIYRDRHGNLNILFGLKECLWHSISQTLSIDVFRVSSLPARIVTAAYAFLVLIITHTYTANLAAFLTVKQLDTKINTVDDLVGKTVATLPTYIERLYDNHRIVAVEKYGWDHQKKTAKLLEGEFQAVISDSTQLVSIANKDSNCDLYILPDRMLPFDIALAYAKGFPHTQLMRRVDGALVELQEASLLEELEEGNSFPEPGCKAATEFVETNKVDLASLLGLWYILGAFLLIATAGGILEYLVWRKTRPEKTREMRERASTLSQNMISGPQNLMRTVSSLSRRSSTSVPQKTSSGPKGSSVGKCGSCGRESPCTSTPNHLQTRMPQQQSLQLRSARRLYTPHGRAINRQDSGNPLVGAAAAVNELVSLVDPVSAPSATNASLSLDTADSGGLACSTIPRLMDTLPSHKSHEPSHEDMISVTHNLLNNSTHSPSVHGALQDGLDAETLTDCPTFMPEGVSLAAITASANTRSMNTIAKRVHDPNSSSDDTDPESEVSFKLGGPRHVCEILPSRQGDTSQDKVAERGFVPLEYMRRSRPSGDGRLPKEEQSIRGLSTCDNDRKPSSNDCEGTPTSQEQAVTLAWASTQKTDMDAVLRHTQRREEYVEELLHLRGIVETLGRHLDLMISNSTTNFSGGIDCPSDEHGSSEKDKL